MRGKTMVKKFMKIAAMFAALAVLATGQVTPASAQNIDLVLGSGSTNGKVFAAGNAMSVAVALKGDGFALFNYGTKGSKENLKRISSKKRAINFAAVTVKALGKAKTKQLKAISGLMALGKTKGGTLLLVVRNKAPKGVSKKAYNAAIASIARILKSSAASKRISKEWAGYAPSSGTAEFKAAGLKMHASAKAM
jgi:hypothetical protein